MPIHFYRPITSGLRRTSVMKDSSLSKERPLKSLTINKKRMSGRNNTGKITVRHRGGGARQMIRIVDFKRDKLDIPATVITLEYDPNRNARIALIQYRDGEKRYMIAPVGLAVGSVVISTLNPTADIAVGNHIPLKYLPTGIEVHNIELIPGKGGQIGRSAGNYAIVSSLDSGMAHLKTPSGEIRMVPEDCRATVGMVSNPEHSNIRWGKAGRMRHRGIRPSVRGKAMNPVDHPHGGGEGKHPIGLKHPKTYTGKIALGVKTRKNKKWSNKMIINSRTKKRI